MKLCLLCSWKYAGCSLGRPAISRGIIVYERWSAAEKGLHYLEMCGIILWNKEEVAMPDSSVPEEKSAHLSASGTLHARPDTVKDPLFQQREFFDPTDAVQVKYEMLRRVHQEGKPVLETAALYGFSRGAFYLAQQAFEECGLPGLLPQKRGPKAPHKLSAEVAGFLRERLREEPSRRAPDLVPLVEEQFGVRVHPRSIERALARGEKKRRKAR